MPQPPRREGELLLSAIAIAIKEIEFTGARVPYESDEGFHALEQRDDLYVHRSRGGPPASRLLIMPLTAETVVEGVRFERLLVRENLSALAALIERRLPTLLPQLDLKVTRWGLDRIRRRDDLLDQAFGYLRSRRPEKMAGFHKFDRTRFCVRTEFVGGRGPRLLMTVEFRRHSEVEPDVAELLRRGFRMEGLEIYSKSDVRREWLGRVERSGGGGVTIRHSGGVSTTSDGRGLFVEASMESFTKLVEQVVGRDFQEKLTQAEWAVQAAKVSGLGFVRRLRDIAKYVAQAGVLSLAPGLSMRFGGPVSLSARGPSPEAAQLPQVQYCFSADKGSVDCYPFSGLDKFGPFDSSSFKLKEPRVLVLCPEEGHSGVDRLLSRLRDGMAREGQKRFARGLVGTYRLRKFSTVVESVPRGPVAGAGARYVKALTAALERGPSPDIVLVVIRDDESDLEVDNPYVAAKAYLLGQGIPSQELRTSVLQKRPADLPYTLENLAVAIYAKLGGVPWTIRPTVAPAKEIVLGMAHAEFGGKRSPGRRIMGITTVFASDGTYLLAAGTRRCTYDEYPQVLADSVRDTLQRLEKEQAWESGDRVRLIFHAPKPLTKDEVNLVVDSATKALGKGILFEHAFLTIEGDHPLKVIAPSEKGRDGFVELLKGGKGMALVGEGAPKRGLTVDLGHSKRLLCVNGPLLMKRQGEPIPQPIQVSLHRSSTYRDIDALTRQVFEFTGLSWRSMLPVNEPVTIFYPRLIAKMLGRFSDLPNWSDNLLDTRLRRSRWFL